MSLQRTWNGCDQTNLLSYDGQQSKSNGGQSASDIATTIVSAIATNCGQPKGDDTYCSQQQKLAPKKKRTNKSMIPKLKDIQGRTTRKKKSTVQGIIATIYYLKILLF